VQKLWVTPYRWCNHWIFDQTTFYTAVCFKDETTDAGEEDDNIQAREGQHGM